MQRPISASAWCVLFSEISYMTDKKNIRTIQDFIPPSSCNCAETMRVDATDIDKEVKKRGGSEGKRSVKGRWKDGFSSLCCPRLLHRSDKTGDTPNCAVLNLQDTHDWCTESFLSLLASMDSEVCGLHTSSSIIFDRRGKKKMKSGIEDKMQQVRFPVHLQCLVIILPAPIMAFWGLRKNKR